jgi:hypothetical protein
MEDPEVLLQARRAIRKGALGVLVQPDLLSAFGADDVMKFDDHNVANVLKGFHDVFPDELPSQLPPDRGVIHAIPIPDGQVPPCRANVQVVSRGAGGSDQNIAGAIRKRVY